MAAFKSKTSRKEGHSMCRKVGNLDIILEIVLIVVPKHKMKCQLLSKFLHLCQFWPLPVSPGQEKENPL